jgi:hypothetical protein
MTAGAGFDMGTVQPLCDGGGVSSGDIEKQTSGDRGAPGGGPYTVSPLILRNRSSAYAVSALVCSPIRCMVCYMTALIASVVLR